MLEVNINCDCKTKKSKKKKMVDIEIIKEIGVLFTCSECGDYKFIK